MKLRAPFPWFGGKSAVAPVVWDRLGDVDNYIEPFFGSGAVLLRRPHSPRTETVNDKDCCVANFWSATQHDPEAVAVYADWPIHATHLYARHRWLVLSAAAKEFRKRIREDPFYYDPLIAGWWVWGICMWIGGGWCAVPGETGGEVGCQQERRPMVGSPGKGSSGRGVQSAEHLHRPQLADAYSLGRGGVHSGPAYCQQVPYPSGSGGMGVHSGPLSSTCAERRKWLIDWFGRLRDRLRFVRVCCGDWSSICSSESVTTRLGTTGVFLDPPYGAKAGRDKKLYSVDSLTVAEEVRQWCLEWGEKDGMRICLAGYEGEGHEVLEGKGWQVYAWKAAGGYGNRNKKGNENAAKERLWFSPQCKNERTLFDGL